VDRGRGPEPRSGARSRGARRRAFALAALTLVAVAVLDQATKALAVATLVPGDAVPVLFGIDLRLVRNTGVAFGVLAGAGDMPIVVITALAVGSVLAFFLVRADRPLLWLPVGMVLGGAAGNLVDRVRLGAVVDFIDPTFWPAFNLADIAIVVGVLGVLYVAEGPAEPRERGAEDKRAGGEGGAPAGAEGPERAGGR
jgi:signal peptidase II